MPEDYELLLRLDCNNFKSTLEEGAIDKFPVLVIGEVKKGKLSTLTWIVHIVRFL